MADEPQLNAEALYQRVFRYALSLCRIREQAEEIAQESFVRFHRERRTPVEDPQVTSYLLVTARRIWIDRFRKSALPQEPAITIESLEDLYVPAPDDRLAVTEEIQRALVLMMQLPQGQREVLYLRTIDDRSIDEIAALTERSRSNVKTQLCLARKRMRELDRCPPSTKTHPETNLLPTLVQRKGADD